MRTRLRRTSVGAVGLLVAVLAGAGPATAAPPVLVTGFGTGGLVTSPGQPRFNAVIGMPDGGVVAAGAGADDAAALRIPTAATLVRYSATGQLVSSFGSAGVARVTRAGSTLTLTNLAHAPGGKLVAFGGYVDGTDSGVIILRVDARTGALDPTFGSGGVLLRGLGPSPEYWTAEGGGTVLPDGRLVVTHRYRQSGASRDQVAVLALTASGAPDPTFGAGDGLVVVPLTAYRLGRAQVAADGRIVVPVVTFVTDSGVPPRLGAARLLPSGLPDSTFGGDGVATRHPFGSFPQHGTVDAVLQPGGRVVVGAGLEVGPGLQFGFFSDTALVRFTARGGTDPSFNPGHGFVRLHAMYVHRIVRTASGDILLAGSDQDGLPEVDPPSIVGRLARVSAAGVPDATFGAGGVRNVRDPGTNQSALDGAAVDPASVLTVAGWRNTNTLPGASEAVPEAMLMRYRTGPAVARRVTFEAGLAGSQGLFRSCGATVEAPCPIGTTWYFQGSAWPLESHDPSRVVVQLDRRGGDGVWHRVSATPVFVTDTGNFRGSGRPVSVGLYRVRAAVPGSAGTVLSYGPWRYLKR
jgi:uncharacterized delta-60 repeat protein